MELQIGGWKKKTSNFTVAPLDDFKVVLGIEFLEPTNAPMLAVRSLFMQRKVCARKKLKQEPDRQISKKKKISIGLKARAFL